MVLLGRRAGTRTQTVPRLIPHLISSSILLSTTPPTDHDRTSLSQSIRHPIRQLSPIYPFPSYLVLPFALEFPTSSSQWRRRHWRLDSSTCPSRRKRKMELPVAMASKRYLLIVHRAPNNPADSTCSRAPFLRLSLCLALVRVKATRTAPIC